MGQCFSTPPLKFHSVKKGKYTINYPNHPPRKDTTLYTRTNRDMCQIRDLPCWICGKNRKAGAATETHHYFVTWVASSAIDWIKFGECAMQWYHPQTGTRIGTVFNWQQVARKPELFVDSQYNMLVLCQEHHRGRLGIHHVPFPEWILQAAPQQGFTFLV